MATTVAAQHRLLLVEDDVALARALALSLQDAGNDVTVASTGDEARRALRERDIDVILLDLGLRDCDGRELCYELRAASDVP